MKTAAIVFAALIVIALSLTGCANGTVRQTSTSTSLYERVMKQGKIRCGYVVNFPGCIKDPNTGKMSGVGVDTLEMLGKNLGLPVEWTEEVGWGSMLEGLQNNRYDIVGSPVWTNSNRARLADFSKPLYFSPIYAWVKAGNKKLTSVTSALLDSDKCSIATIDGETAEIIAKEDFPNAKKVSLPQMSDPSQNLLTVSSGKADLTFAESAVAAGFLKTNPGSVQILSPDHPVRVFPNCWMFRRGEMEFKDMLDAALDQVVNSGAEDKILRKYEPAPNTLYRVALPYQLPAKGK